LSLVSAVDAEFPDDPKRKALAIRRAPLTLRSGSRIVAAEVFEERLNEAVTSGPTKKQEACK
jgi:hypothetical protein